MEIRLAITKFSRRSLAKILKDPEKTSIGIQAPSYDKLSATDLDEIPNLVETEARFLPDIPSNDLDAASAHKTVEPMIGSLSTLEAPRASLKIVEALKKIRQVEDVFDIDREMELLPWAMEVSSELVLAEQDASDSFFNDSKLHLYNHFEHFVHNLVEYSQQDAQMKTHSE